MLLRNVGSYQREEAVCSYEMLVATYTSTQDILFLSCRSVVLNLGVATQNWVAGNIPKGRECFIKVTLFFILDERFDKSESVWKRK
jgi:hypothetical protein